MSASVYLVSLLALYLCCREFATALTSFEQGFLDDHNAKRRAASPSAANMRELKWSKELATIAQNYANKCIYRHNPDKNAQSTSFAEVGENLYYNTAQVSPLTVVTWWDDEKNFYNFDANTCSDVCGHYTQVVWAETEYVGCAVAFCPSLVNVDWSSVYYYVCNYGKSGNMNGARPYIKGSSCSQCPSGYTCNNGLCRSSIKG